MYFIFNNNSCNLDKCITSLVSSSIPSIDLRLCLSIKIKACSWLRRNKQSQISFFPFDIIFFLLLVIVYGSLCGCVFVFCKLVRPDLKISALFSCIIFSQSCPFLCVYFHLSYIFPFFEDIFLFLSIISHYSIRYKSLFFLDI